MTWEPVARWLPNGLPLNNRLGLALPLCCNGVLVEPKFGIHHISLLTEER